MKATRALSPEAVTSERRGRSGRGFRWALAALGSVLVAGPASAQEAWLTLLNPTNSLDFGQRGIGVPGTPRVVTLGNAGTVALSISSVTVAGLDPTDFIVVADECTAATLAPDQACNVTMDFAPATTGARSARLRLVDSAPGSPLGTNVFRVSGPGVGTVQTNLFTIEGKIF